MEKRYLDMLNEFSREELIIGKEVVAKLNKKKWIAIGASIGTLVVLAAAWYSGVSSLFKKMGCSLKEVGLKGGLKSIFTKDAFLIGPKPL